MRMQALLVIDAQNEFSNSGLRPVPNHAEALRRIMVHVNRARENKQPIAWIREALIRGYDVLVDPQATGACDLSDELLGSQTADEVRRSALLHLRKMGARLVSDGVGKPHCEIVVA
jgi:nicotinamidase-related amidase